MLYGQEKTSVAGPQKGPLARNDEQQRHGREKSGGGNVVDLRGTELEES